MYGSLFDKPFLQQMLFSIKPGMGLFNDAGGGTGGGGAGAGAAAGAAGAGAGAAAGAAGAAGVDANAALLAEIKAMRAEITELKGKGAAGAGAGNDPSIAERVEAERKVREKNKLETDKIERDISYNMGILKFAEDHKSHLAENIGEIITAADKQKFDNHAEKASTLRTEIIDAFFKVQSNLDILTPAQKRNLADFQKLTKDGKRQESEKVYESVFEPALEMVKRVKKAEELNLAARGFATAQGGPLAAYKAKLYEAAKRVIINKRKAG